MSALPFGSVFSLDN